MDPILNYQVNRHMAPKPLTICMRDEQLNMQQFCISFIKNRVRERGHTLGSADLGSGGSGSGSGSRVRRDRLDEIGYKMKKLWSRDGELGSKRPILPCPRIGRSCRPEVELVARAPL